MILAKAITNELREALCWKSAESGIAYAIIARELEPVGKALEGLLLMLGAMEAVDDLKLYSGDRQRIAMAEQVVALFQSDVK